MTLEEYVAKFGEKEGVKRWKNNEKSKRWRQKNPEKLKEVNRQQYLKLKDNEEFKQKNREKANIYYNSHSEEVKKRVIQWQKENVNAYREKMHKYRTTQYGRASHLVDSYKVSDRKNHRGECTLTAKWIVNNIFNRPCLYCNQSDWRLLGCDRIDNSKPHTPENVVCSCDKCNNKRGKKEFLDYAYSIGAKDSESLVIEY